MLDRDASLDDAERTLAHIAIEVWRLGKRLDATGEAPERIRASYDRILLKLHEGGVEVRDPTGERFVEGMNAEVIDMPPADPVGRSALVVADVLRPAVFLRGTCVIAPQVVLATEVCDRKET